MIMKLTPTRIILIGALVLALSSCSNTSDRKEFEVQVNSDMFGQTLYSIGVTTRDPYFNYQLITEYDKGRDEAFTKFFTDRTEAIFFAKRFIDAETVYNWQDSVTSLVKNKPQPIKRETIKIY